MHTDTGHQGGELKSIDLDRLDLAALLSSRVCHDVINPVGAIVNGLEVLDEETDPEMRDHAIALIRNSAQQASARLQFARLAFGAAGSAGASIDLGDAEAVSKSFIQDARVKLIWEAPRLLLPKNKVKLVLNMLVIAATSIVRGGTITMNLSDDNGQTNITITAVGPSSRQPQHVADLLEGLGPDGALNAHGIQPYYTGLIARAAGMRLTIGHEGETFTMRAVPA